MNKAHPLKLWVSLRSPFARRVRVALRELGVAHEERLVDVFAPTAEFLAVNPLGRVPVAEFEDGTRLAESQLILNRLAEAHGRRWTLLPEMGPARWECYHWMSYGVGICEKVVEYFLFPEVEGELKAMLARVLPEAEKAVGHAIGTGTRGPLTQASIDWGCALSYLSLRYSRAWRESYPQLAGLLDELEKRPAFAETTPRASA